MNRPLLRVGLAAALAFSLAACGGGSGTQAKPTWALASASTGDCWSVAMATLPDGSFGIAGGFYGVNVLGANTATTTTVAGADSSDVFLARVTPQGELLWARGIVGADYTDATAVVTGPDGSLYVCGYFFGSATFAAGEPEEITFTTTDGEDGFLARYDEQGRLVWARQVASASIDELHGLAITPDGALMVVGLFADVLTLGAGEVNETTLTPTGWIEALVACYETDGSLRWARGSVTTGYGGAWGVAVLADGSVAVGGDFTGSMTHGAGEAQEATLDSVGGTSDVFLVRYDAAGELLWARCVGGADEDYASGVAAAPDGGMRLTGLFALDATFGAGDPAATVLTSAGRHDGFCANYDAAGALVWVTQLAGPEHDEILEVRVEADGATTLLGDFVGTTTVGAGLAEATVLVAPDPLDREIALVSYGPDGRIRWGKAFGGVGDNTAVGSRWMPDGTAIVIGSFMDELRVGGTAILTGVADKSCAYVARIDPQSGD